MSNKKHFYITTTLPYVNSDPHIGFALEIIQADVVARYHRLLGEEVIFNTGTDEHGIKIYRKALEAGQEPQAYVDEYAAKFDQLRAALNLSYTNFIRTTQPAHKAAAQEFWRRCLAAGDIYKKAYQVKYCVGCELEKTDSELVDGRCPIHPTTQVELIEEENYFFRFSKYQQSLLDLYQRQPELVVPAFRFNEIKQFVADGLIDFSISRLKTKMPWGVPIPDDSDQVMYVWFDALVNYVSTLGWPTATDFDLWWGTQQHPNAVQVAGKDNLRQQSAMWQAMLLSAGLPPTKQIMIHGFVVKQGQKISKSLGNAVDPFDLARQYSIDGLRYLILRHFHPFEDSDFSDEKFLTAYTADLANGLGNLVSRVTGLIAQYNLVVSLPTETTFDPAVGKYIERFEFDQALKHIWTTVAELDGLLTAHKPWSLAKEGKLDEATVILQQAAVGLLAIATNLQPFMPTTAATILASLQAKPIVKAPGLFPRIEIESGTNS